MSDRQTQQRANGGTQDHCEHSWYAEPQRDGANNNPGGPSVDDQMAASGERASDDEALISAGATKAMTLVSGAGG